ncbi:MAG TPA: polysaccharide deacetylase family protein [Gaiellaceae bacterium]|nr:polysaccharide deacetylase family protein [Gaiellaceae bacterium]
MASTPLVLCYHAVSERWEDPLAVSPRALLAQVRSLLARGLRPAAADEVCGGDARSFHVTFDDAYRSVEEVLPALRGLGVGVTVFACSDLAAEGAALAVPEVAPRAVGHEEEILTMDWEALRRAAALGVEIGSHTRSHPHLTRLGDEELRTELADSRRALEEHIQRPCRYLAYPYGESDDRVRHAAREAGYEAAYALASRPSEGPYGIPRADVYRGDGHLRFRLKTSRLLPLARAGARLLR